MKFEIKNEILNTIITKVSYGLSTRNVIESLNGIKITVDSNNINFITSRQDLSILYKLSENFNVYEEGEVIIPAKFLSAINKDANNGITTIDAKENSGVATIKSQHSEISACTYSTGNYPLIDFQIPSGIEPIKISAKQLKKIHKATQHSASMVKDHQCFMGIHFEFNEDEVKCYSTDSRRLSIFKLSLHSPINANFTINKELIKIICSLINDEDDLKFYYDKSQLIITFGNYIVKCALITEEYPDLNRLIINSDEVKYKFSVNKNHIIPILEKIDDLNKNVLNPNVTINFEGNLGIITSEFQDFGSLKENFVVQELSGKPIEFTLEPRYLLQTLNALDEEIVTFNIKDEISPILITNANNLDNLQEISPIKR